MLFRSAAVLLAVPAAVVLDRMARGQEQLARMATHHGGFAAFACGWRVWPPVAAVPPDGQTDDGKNDQKPAHG